MESQTGQCSISSTTFQKLFLLIMVGNFSNGIYGSKRFHKVAYLIERETKVKPFTYIKHYYGQYSEELDTIKEQLISLGFIKAEPLDTSRTITFQIGDREINFQDGGNRYYLSDKIGAVQASDLIDKVFPGIVKQIAAVIKNYGYLKEPDLIKHCYSLGDFKKAKEGEVILESNTGKKISVKGLDENDCEGLEMALSGLVSATNKIVEALEETTIIWSKIKKVALPI